MVVMVGSGGGARLWLLESGHDFVKDFIGGISSCMKGKVNENSHGILF